MTINFEQLKLEAIQAKNKLAEQADLLSAKQDILSEEIKRLIDAFNVENAELIRACSGAEAVATQADLAVRDAAKSYYETTGDKQIGFGISVRVSPVYEYDEQKAVAYAIDHKMPHLLKVDSTKFKKFASITPMDFVTTSESVTAVVSYKEDSDDSK